MFNHVFLEGVLTLEAKVRLTPSGESVATLELEHASESHDTLPIKRMELKITVLLLGQLAEACRGLPEGSVVKVQGRLNQKRWIRDNRVRWGKTELIANQLDVLFQPPSPQKNGPSTSL